MTSQHGGDAAYTRGRRGRERKRDAFGTSDVVGGCKDGIREGGDGIPAILKG